MLADIIINHKTIKMKRTFLDKMDVALFKHLNAGHEPTTTQSVWYGFLGGAITALAAFTLQMCGASREAQSVVIGILGISAFAFVLWKSLDEIKGFDAWWKSVLYTAYLLFFSGIAFAAGVWALTLAICILFIMLILKIFFPSNKKSKRGKVIFSDGTEKEARQTGKGICGEEYWTDEDGGQHVKY